MSKHPVLKEPVVINVGLEEFVDSLKKQGAKVIKVQWKPPQQEDESLLDLLDELL